VQIRIWHTTIMWLFITFTALHVYLVMTEDRRMVRAMIDGYYSREVTEGKSQG
jgi:Ni,Fe-hydrogenase I cytochrome b subunit